MTTNDRLEALEAWRQSHDAQHVADNERTVHTLAGTRLTETTANAEDIAALRIEISNLKQMYLELEELSSEILGRIMLLEETKRRRRDEV